MTTTIDSHTDAARLWALCGLGSCQFWRSTGHGSGWLLPHAALAVSGEPHPLMNWAVVAAGDDPEAELRLFVARLRELHLPGYILLASAVADQLERTARELRLHGPHTTHSCGATAVRRRRPAPTTLPSRPFTTGRASAM